MLEYTDEKRARLLMHRFFNEMPPDSQMDPYTIKDFVKWLVINKLYDTGAMIKMLHEDKDKKGAK